MIDISIDALISKIKNKFLLSNAVATRAKQIIEGSLPYIEDFDPTNPAMTALKEIAANRFKIKVISELPKEEKISKEKPPQAPALERLAKEEKKKYKKKKKKKK